MTRCLTCRHLDTRSDPAVSRPVTVSACALNPEWVVIRHSDAHYCSFHEPREKLKPNYSPQTVKGPPP